MYNDLRNEDYTSYIARLFPIENEQLGDSSTFNITFQVTDNCNLCCSYCYQINKGTHVMPFDVAKKFIDMLLANDENTRYYVDTTKKTAAILDFIGGEPLLEVELIDKIIDYFQEATIRENHPWQYNFRVSISSNGTLYFKPEVQRFIQKHLSHLSFGVSIDGNKKLHDACRVFPDGSGSYDIAIAAVHHYRDVYKGEMGSKMTLAPENIQYTAEAIIGLIESGYTNINLNCVFEKGWEIEHATCFYYQLKLLTDYLLDNNLQEKIILSIFDERLFCPKSKDDIRNWCGGNGLMIAVDYKGDIYPCVRYMESSLGSEVAPIIIGNVATGIAQTDLCKHCIDNLKSVNRLTQSTEECINCRIAEGCAWCQAYNYQASGGNINQRATYICIMHQARALANSYYYNRLYLQTNQEKRMKIWLEDEKALQIIPMEELALLKLLQYPVL